VQQRPILVLGGGRHQIGLVQYFQATGYPVVLSDFLKDSPGHDIADVSTLTNALDRKANIELAQKHNVQGVITTGTDQPLVIMADVAHKLSIPCYLTPESARSCTDKTQMFQVLSRAGVEIPKYIVVTGGEQISEVVSELRFPLVVKPSDSQGQRGITVAHNTNELVESINQAFMVSSSAVVIVQEYLFGPEMTISAWVTQGKSQIMLITDRVTYNRPPATGVCLQHIYPSLHIQGLEKMAVELVNQITNAYGMEEGPIYIQCVRAEDSLYLIEATCRIGGGHEELLIEFVTGVKIHRHLLSLTLKGHSYSFPKLGDFPIASRYAMVNFLVAKPGTFHTTIEPEHTLENPCGSFYYGAEYLQHPITNSMGRVGYFVYKSTTRESMMERAAALYQEFRALDSGGENLVFWPPQKYLNQ
jgi:biotin carboxylase